LQVDYHVWSEGEYKSFIEMVTRDDMSAQDREASGAFLRGLWAAYQLDVTSARELQGDALQRYADEAVFLLQDAGGDSGALALRYGLVDELATRDRVRARVRELVGSSDEDDDEYPNVDHDAYLTALHRTQPESFDDKIAVVVAAGQILDGIQPAGTIGGESLAEDIRRITRDDDVDALVLRVDSPGGSAFASDLILRELELFQETGRPLVVSMSSVAASGGYWISMSADEIWASPATLTGSIGVFAMFPTLARFLDRWGVHVDGLGTTALAGQFDPTRPLGEDADELVRQVISHAYDDFVGKVAAARELPVVAVDAAAQGRVWVGADALAAGLVDQLGDLEDAVAAAAERAGLEAGRYQIEYVERPLGYLERLAVQYAGALAPLAAAWQADRTPSWPAWVQRAASRFEAMAQFNDPRGTYAYCFCDLR
jgi:protease-4